MLAIPLPLERDVVKSINFSKVQDVCFPVDLGFNPKEVIAASLAVFLGFTGGNKWCTAFTSVSFEKKD
jgi:hypothetical protein